VSRTGISCVVFDIDDTLYLERDYVRSGFVAVAARVRESLGFEDFLDRAWDAFQDGARGSVFDHVLGEYGIGAGTVVPDLVEVYRRHRPDIALLPDARACLDRLRGRRILAAVTGGPVQSQRAKVEALRLHRWLAPIVFTSELGDGAEKPASRAFQLVEESVGVSGRRCAYVADNPTKDFGGPVSLGWVTVRVRRPESLHASVENESDVDAEIADLSGLEAVLDRRA
jgi:putative hydrolase of the HAD superfamily